MARDLVSTRVEGTPTAAGIVATESKADSPIARTVILIAVFNDWDSLAELLPRLDVAIDAAGLDVDVLVVDDGSTWDPPEDLVRGRLRALRRIDVLTLRRNLGHQRAIAVGLAYAEDRLNPEAVVVMDGDGEDDPADVPRLLARLRAEGGRAIVFAERTRRSESWKFRVGYTLFQVLHYALTGERVRVGNFSAIPRRRLASLVAVAEMWNHYAAAVFRSRQPYCMIPTRRARRLRGRSTMNLVAMVTHGLSAISVFGDVVGVRLLVAALGLALAALGSLVAVVVIRLTTSLAIPGWATFAAGLSLVVLMQAIGLSFLFSFLILWGRHGTSVLPLRDYPLFVRRTRVLFERAPVPAPN